MSLKALIYSKGFRQFDVAKQIGRTETYLSYLVTGRKAPTDEDIKSLSKLLGVSQKTVQEAFRE